MLKKAVFMRRAWLCLAPLAVMCAEGAAHGAEMTDYAPLAEAAGATAPVESWQEPMAPPPVSGLNWRALGPFFESRSTPDGERAFRALLRPVYSDFYSRSGTTSGRDILWPIGFTRNRPDSEFQFFFPFLHTKPHHGADGMASDRWWLMPVVFYGHDNQARPYFGLFPLGGRISNFFGFDHVNFFLFPLYVGSHKSTFDAHTVLWPVFSRTKGECVDKFRVWPFYGQALFYGRSPDTEAKWLQDERRFYLWPFVHTSHIHPRPGAPYTMGLDAWFVLPFCGSGKQTDASGRVVQKSWTVLWPFFSGDTCTLAGREKSRTYCPWPFIRLSRETTPEGTETHTNYWPFYGRTDRPACGTAYVMWPFWWTGSAKTSAAVERKWSALAPFWWSSELCRKDEAAPEKPAVLEQNFKQLWPVWSFQREQDKSRLAVLALWPRRAPDGVNRNYAPLWTLYSRETQGAEIRHEALWGWWKLAYNAPQPMRWSLAPFAEYHREDANGGWYLSIGKGLLAWGRADGEKKCRALWFFKW